MKDIIVIGAGGHGKVIADIIKAAGNNFLGFLDDTKHEKTLGKISDYNKFSNAEFIIAIGNSKDREKIAKELKCSWHTAIHPSAIVSKSAQIAEGTVIMPNAVVNANSSIGKHSIINTSAVVEHDNIIGNYSHISVGVKLGGTISVGSHCWLGIGSCVANNICICSNAYIGAGSVVVKNIDRPGKYYGVPAKFVDES